MQNATTWSTLRTEARTAIITFKDGFTGETRTNVVAATKANLRRAIASHAEMGDVVLSVA